MILEINKTWKNFKTLFSQETLECKQYVTKYFLPDRIFQLGEQSIEWNLEST